MSIISRLSNDEMHRVDSHTLPIVTAGEQRVQVSQQLDEDVFKLADGVGLDEIASELGRRDSPLHRDGVDFIVVRNDAGEQYLVATQALSKAAEKAFKRRGEKGGLRVELNQSQGLKGSFEVVAMHRGKDKVSPADIQARVDATLTDLASRPRVNMDAVSALAKGLAIPT